MEETLYEYQNYFYYTLATLYILRCLINFIIYDEIESKNVIPEYGLNGTSPILNMDQFKSLTPKEIEYRKNKIKGYDPNNFDYYQNRLHQFFYYPFTFWWSINQNDSLFVKRLKKICNILNMPCLIMTLLIPFLFLYLQDINFLKSN